MLIDAFRFVGMGVDPWSQAALNVIRTLVIPLPRREVALMAIDFTCPNCQRSGQLPDNFSGNKIKCPACQTISPVANAEDVIPLAPEPEPRRSSTALRTPKPPDAAPPARATRRKSPRARRSS